MNAPQIRNTGLPVLSSPATTAENRSMGARDSSFADRTVTSVSPGNRLHGVTRPSSTHSLSELSFSSVFQDPRSSSTESLSQSERSSSFSRIALGDSDDFTHNPEFSEVDYNQYVDLETGAPVNPGSEPPHDPLGPKK